MRLPRISSLLFAMIFALTLTLPSRANKGPAPITEKQKIECNVVTFEKAILHTPTAITRADRDIGLRVDYAVTGKAAVADLWVTDLYLERPLRQRPTTYGYIPDRLCKGATNKIRPPAILM